MGSDTYGIGLIRRIGRINEGGNLCGGMLVRKIYTNPGILPTVTGRGGCHFN